MLHGDSINSIRKPYSVCLVHQNMDEFLSIQILHIEVRVSDKPQKTTESVQVSAWKLPAAACCLLLLHQHQQLLQSLRKQQSRSTDQPLD